MNRLMHAQVEDHPANAVAGEPAVSEFAVVGMNCNNCARQVTEAIQRLAGVENAVVRLEEGRATVRWHPGAEPNVERVVQAVKAAGYDATPVAETARLAEPQGSSPMAAWKFTVLPLARRVAGEVGRRLGRAADESAEPQGDSA